VKTHHSRARVRSPPGPIPRWIADCFPHLKELDLSFGRLSGSIPDWIPVMGNHLQQLKVQQNALSGAVPPGIGSMPNLRVLWLHHNNLRGALPADLGRAPSLVRCACMPRACTRVSQCAMHSCADTHTRVTQSSPQPGPAQQPGAVRRRAGGAARGEHSIRVEGVLRESVHGGQHGV
jgi:hypothetical protein